MNDIVERLERMAATAIYPKEVREAAAEIEQWRSRFEELQAVAFSRAAEINTLRAALEPFARNIEAVSLSGALGHITREHLHNARRALEHKP